MLKVLTLGELPELDMQLDASVRAKCQKLPGSVQREHKLLSYSGVNLLFGCPRKYQLSKAVPYDKENTVHTAFGSAFGAGVQTYLVTGSKDYAIVAAASAWHMGLFDNDTKSNKSLATCVLWLEKWIHSYGAYLLTEYKVFEVEGKPAIELAGCITLGNGYSYRMFVDAVLQDRESGELLVLEIKTTGSVVDPVTYNMSDQGTGYGVLVDALAKKYTYLVASRLPIWCWNPKQGTLHISHLLNPQKSGFGGLPSSAPLQTRSRRSTTSSPFGRHVEIIASAMGERASMRAPAPSSI